MEHQRTWQDRAEELEREVERLRARTHEIATEKDREKAELESQVARYRNAIAEAREAVREFRADWTTDPPSQEPDGLWRYASLNTVRAMSRVMYVANEKVMKYRVRAQEAEDRAWDAVRAYKALAQEASDLLGERAPGAAALFEEAAERGPFGDDEIDPRDLEWQERFAGDVGGLKGAVKAYAQVTHIPRGVAHEAVGTSMLQAKETAMAGLREKLMEACARRGGVCDCGDRPCVVS